MIANSVFLGQTGSVTQKLSPRVTFYRRMVVGGSTHVVDPSEVETSAIESDQVLLSTVIHRLREPSFLSIEEALNLPTPR